MNFLKAISTVTSAADTVFGFATFNWTKKNVVLLAVTSVVLTGVTAIVAKISSNESEEIEQAQCDDSEIKVIEAGADTQS